MKRQRQRLLLHALVTRFLTENVIPDVAALEASGLLQLRRDIDLAQNKTGIFSRPVKLGDTVEEGDRVEIYRPLIADPKELRRQRAERAATKK
ncbi:hypothetical protein CRX72_25480 [Pantoea sp. BRM17]|nr:hypothetical protein CRX72_25480 [Pantoea sp. BRM17]